jgi:hypothetical protein
VELAAQIAAEQWATGVLPVLVSYMLKPRHVCEVVKSPMIVAVDGTSERYGWTVHLGPVIGRLWGPRGSTGELGELDAYEVYQAVFNTLHPFAAHRNTFWLECFGARYADGKVDATCRLRNNDWDEGRAALLLWASQWPDTKGHILSKRQFILLEPTPMEELMSQPDLVNALESHLATKQRPWWKRLLGVA